MDQIDWRGLAWSVVRDIWDPACYVVTHAKSVIFGKPSDKEVQEYGKQVGFVLINLADRASSAFKALSKAVKTMDKAGDAAKGAYKLKLNLQHFAFKWSGKRLIKLVEHLPQVH
ncbi:MAG: hypothetical protein ACRC5C_10610 [Bacilli bacterium]